MKSNSKATMEPPFDLNPLTQIWKTFDASHVFMHFFIKYFKLVEMAIVHVLGNVEDERCFSSLAFFKSKVQATLDPHLPLFVGMYSQKNFTLKSFPYVATFYAWVGVTNCYDILALMTFFSKFFKIA
jgi:hypothetical protein